jgi:hypothetical protein
MVIQRVVTVAVAIIIVIISFIKLSVCKESLYIFFYITCFITESTISPSRQRQNSPKSRNFTLLYLNNHLIINSNNLNLDFYIHFTVSIKVAL